MSYLSFLLSVVSAVAIAVVYGGRKALWLCWVLGILAMPVWLRFEIGAMRLDLRTGFAIGGLLGFLTRSEPLALRRLLIADVLVVVLAVAEMISDVNIGEFGKFTIPEGVRNWVLPYFVGRVFFQSCDEIVGALQPFCKVALGISLFSLFEAVSKFHIINKALGKSYAILESGEGYRMGLKRSQGMTDHPIYFGLILVLLLPFAIQAAREARGTRPKWWRLVPWLMGGALFGTVSRGPQVAGLAASGIAFFFGNRRWRVPLLILALAGGVGAVLVKDQIVATLEAAGGDTAEEERYIKINGEDELYSGTRHRMLLFKVYADALATTGMFGFGNKLKGIELEEHLAERFWSIDSHYVRFYLQRGAAGLVTFILIQVWTLIHLLRIAWPNDGPRAGLAGGLFGALAGLAVVMFSVWFTPDFGTIWTFTAGVTANLVVLPLPTAQPTADEPEAAAPRSSRPTPRLFPGHAPRRNAANPHRIT